MTPLITNQTQTLFRCKFVLLMMLVSLAFTPIVNANSNNAKPQNANVQSNRPQTTKSHKIVFISPGHADQGFWKTVTDTMRTAADQLGFELEVHHADRQWIKMVHNAEEVIARHDKPDFLILVNEYQQGARLLALADKAGIPTLLLLNSLTPEQRITYGAPRAQLKNWLGSLTPDNKIAGYEMALSLLPKLNLRDPKHLTPGHGEQTIALLTLAGDNSTPASLARLQGLDNALSEFSQLKEQRRFSVNWSESEAYKRTRLWLQSGHKLEAVWAANDAIALGSIKAIREAGLKPGIDVKVSGLNWSQEAINHVINGEMSLSHGGHFLAGAWIMVMLYDYVHGHDFEAISSEINFPMTAITQANAPNYLAHFGSQQWSQINFKNFTLSHSPKPANYEFTLNKLLQSMQNQSVPMPKQPSDHQSVQQ